MPVCLIWCAPIKVINSICRCAMLTLLIKITHMRAAAETMLHFLSSLYMLPLFCAGLILCLFTHQKLASLSSQPGERVDLKRKPHLNNVTGP